MLASNDLKLLLDSLPDTLLVCDEQGFIDACNDECEALLGYRPDQLVGLSVEVLVPEALRQAHIGYCMAYMMAPKRRSMFQLQEISAVRRDGSLQPVSIALSPIVVDGANRTLVCIRDNSAALAARLKEKEMFERLLQKQRLENLGLLSSGIAHDFRNLLSVILGNAELALYEAGATQSALGPYIQAIRGASGRLHELSNQILRYAAGRDAQPQRMDLNAAVREIAVLLERALTPDARLFLELAEDPPVVVLDSGHLFQILLNLILNANDAISPQGGSITVRTGMDADGVFVQVIDDGRGMDAATLRHILEPFYTTKTGGKGLGLSVVNDIVRRYDGSIEIDSDVGNGSRFTVAFRTAG